MFNFNKCPYCGSQKFDVIKNLDSNQKYVLVKADTSVIPAQFSNSSMVVEVYGCADCKAVVLRNNTIIFES